MQGNNGSGNNPNNKKSFIDIFFVENWKQQNLVKQKGSRKALSSMITGLEVLATMAMVMAASASGGGSMVVPAIAATAYTAATVNNSLDRNLHGLIGFLDSPAAIFAVSAFLISQFSGVNPLGDFLYYMLIVPFVMDAIISGVNATQEMLTSQATVEEMNEEREENFISSNEVRQERMYDPSEVLMPEGLRGDNPIGNLCMQSWRDNGFREDKSLTTQFLSLAMIAGYLTLGGVLVSNGSNEIIGGASIAYALSGLLGYFGIGHAPVVAFARNNINSVILAIMGLLSVVSGGMSLPLLMITMMHIFDVMQGVSQQEQNLATSAHDNTGSTRDQAGTVARFFLDSWKTDAFNRKNYFTCQMIQMLMMGVQAYIALICLVGGGVSPAFMVPMLGYVAASAYSYFSPLRLAGVDALQSNGAQVALLGGATYQIVAANPSTSFYALFCLMAVDTMMSLQQFFEENQNTVVRNTSQQMGLLQKDQDGPNGFGDYRRQ